MRGPRVERGREDVYASQTVSTVVRIRYDMQVEVIRTAAFCPPLKVTSTDGGLGHETDDSPCDVVDG